ncbi:MAG: hypothetical protein ACI4Q4_02170, partial [Oscillospiraceae bacterium]
RSSVVASTMQQYITRTIRNTPAIKVFTNAKIDDTLSGEAIDTDEDYQKIVTWLATGSNASNYELRCICLRPVYDAQNETTSILMYQEFFSDTAVGIDSTSEVEVFNACFYGGLFPEILIKPATNEFRSFGDEEPAETAETAETAESAESGEGEDGPVTLRPGIELTINMYDDDELDVANMIYSGYGLIELYNVSSSSDSSSDYIFENKDLGTGNETLIFYLARKINLP